jgi:hypothetical protein
MADLFEMLQVNPAFAPSEPQSIEETGLPESAIESLILKILYFRGDLYGQDLSAAIGLRFSVIQDIVETLKLRHHIQIKRSLGMGNVGAVLALTEAGRQRAHESLETNQYTGRAPVPLNQYVEVVRQQRLAEGWLTREALAKALSGLVLTERLLSQVGPAISSANSMLIYGKPGDGKTFLVESLNNLDAAPVYVPFAIECQGNIIQVYDPIYHERLEEEDKEPSPIAAVSDETPHDRRWVKCRRPFIMTGGELTLEMLDLKYNDTSKVYEAPFQLKANNGIYLIDDFGRQRATPAEVLNRWIVPMERRVDYLNFMTGGKMTVPFEAFLVFSTNLNPADLGDEAFLRRIQYKLLLHGPSQAEFTRIFEQACKKIGLSCTRELIEQVIERHYRSHSKPFRRCQPRDVLSHAINLINFEKLPRELNPGLLDRAFESCFVQEEDGPLADSPIVRAPVISCSDFWSGRLKEIPVLFGKLAFLATLRDRAKGGYRDPKPSPDYDAAEISETLARMHVTLFRQWLGMNLEGQSQDFAEYLATPEGRAAFLSFDRRELVAIMTPDSVSEDESTLFRDDLTVLTTLVSRRQREEAAAPVPVLMERTA